MTKMVITLQFLLVGYLLYSLTKNVYDSYIVDKYIEQFRDQNEGLALENKQKVEDYLYYTSDEYIDRIAKQTLGLVNPGEKVIIISEEPDALASADIEELEVARYREMSVPRQWWSFFFN